MGDSPSIAIIGGSGFYRLHEAETQGQQDFIEQDTPYSNTPVNISIESVNGQTVFFLARHGEQHSLPPHRVNYRANLWALKQAGAQKIIAINSVGAINTQLKPGQIAIPDQLIDYTWGREHSFFDGLDSLNDHIDFTHPFSESLRQIFIQQAKALAIPLAENACVACTQGPRLETAAEIRKLDKDGCDLVGMTLMPEAALARELQLDYASIALIVNLAAGLSETLISIDEIRKILSVGLADVRKLLSASLPALIE